MSEQNLIETHTKHGDIYKNIETTQKELSTANNWLEKNRDSEDAKVTAKFVPTQNKRDRLESELDTMFATLKDLEVAARNYLNSERAAGRAREALKGVDDVLAGLDTLRASAVHFTNLSPFKAELEKVKKDNENAVNLFQHYNGIFHNTGV